MPSSAKDRFTVDFEKIFFFTKSKKYYFEKQLEKYSPNTFPRMLRGVSGNNKWVYGPEGQTKHTISQPRNNIKKDFFDYQGQGIKDYKKAGVQNPSDVKRRILRSIERSQQGRNKRCVWTITTKPFKEAHFATYPEELCRIPIKAGCPEFVCKKCGKGRQRIYKDTGNFIGQGGYGSKTAEHIKVSPTSSLLTKKVKEKKVNGLTDCGCKAGFQPGIVLDPFIGSGTTAVVALNLGLNFIGIELNSKYVAIAEKRIKETPQKLLRTL
jgi:hypothetical protein